MKTNPSGAPASNPPSAGTTARLPFQRVNYLLLIAGMLLLALGYGLMSTEKFIDSKQFSLALHVSPILILGGYAGIIFAILYRPKAK